MVAVGFVPEEYLNIKLLILYAKAEDLDTAHFLFYFFSYRNLVSWNAMIAGYVQKGQDEVGLSLVWYRTIIRLHQSLGPVPPWPFWNRESESMCLERNVITWTALISGYGFNGRVVEVLASFHLMINEGFRPNQITFLAVLSACNHGTFVDEGREYFSSMVRDYGVKPRGRHYAAIVDLLGRGGMLEEAYAFVQMSPFKKHPAVWGALLGACKIHGNMEMVKLAAKKFFELEPENTGKYIVLCNAYATFGLWDNVAEIRSMMKGCRIKKEPGYSMVEVQMEAHFFFMGHNAPKQLSKFVD